MYFDMDKIAILGRWRCSYILRDISGSTLLFLSSSVVSKDFIVQFKDLMKPGHFGKWLSWKPCLLIFFASGLTLCRSPSLPVLKAVTYVRFSLQKHITSDTNCCISQVSALMVLTSKQHISYSLVYMLTKFLCQPYLGSEGSANSRLHVGFRFVLIHIVKRDVSSWTIVFSIWNTKTLREQAEM